jgi:4,5-dihydroxyphthalate decarboxylase
MANPKLRFRFREPTVDTNLPLTDGTVKIDGFDLEVLGGSEDSRFEADARDEGFGALVQRKVKGAPDVCIPAFPNRKFRLSYIFVNAASGIEKPKDLEGRRVGIPGWGNTAGVWARGALQNYYNVDLTAINWHSTRPGDGSGLPDGVTLKGIKGNLSEMLVNGDLDAVIEPNVLPSITKEDPRVRRLFPDYKAEEQEYYRKTGIFPISHVVTLRQDFVDEHPNAPLALLKAFRAARDEAFDRILGSDPQYLVISWVNAAVQEQRELMGHDYFAYNVKDNHRPLEAVTRFAHQQGLTPAQLDYNSFFAKDAAVLAGM